MTDKTRAVFLTHVQGFNGLTDELLADLKQRGIPLIEDVCESHGATHDGKRLGSFGWMSNFSFYYAHHMSTIEGGMVCTDDADRLRAAAHAARPRHGARDRPTPTSARRGATRIPTSTPTSSSRTPAYNVRNTEIGGIMGRSQLKRLDANVVRRTKNLQPLPGRHRCRPLPHRLQARGQQQLRLQPDPEGRRRRLRAAADGDACARPGIEFRRGSAGGGNQVRQPYLRGIVPADHHREFPNTEHVHFYGFYIGNFPDIRDDEIDAICRIVNGV